MIEGKGTPKTLRQAVEETMTMGPAKEIPDRMQENVRDYLAQRFNVAMFQALNEGEADRLMKLFKSIVNE